MEFSWKSDFLYNTTTTSFYPCHNCSYLELYLLTEEAKPSPVIANRSIDRFRSEGRPGFERRKRGGRDDRLSDGISEFIRRATAADPVSVTSVWYTRDQTFLYINVASFQCRPSTTVVLRCTVVCYLYTDYSSSSLCMYVSGVLSSEPRDS